VVGAVGVCAGDEKSVGTADGRGLIYHYVRGYWLTRYLEETQREFIRGLLARRHARKDLEARIADACGLAPAAFWQQIDAKVVLHFGQRGVT
jgi:hypothetical protein